MLTQRITASVRENTADLLAYLVRRIDPPGDAADVFSEVLVTVWRKSRALPEAPEDARRWMFGIARKHLLRHYRTTSRQRAVATRLRDSLAAISHPGFIALDTRLDLHDAIRRLDRIDRDILGLVHWEGFTLVETSTIVGMKESTVRSRYHRARARLRQYLSDDEDDPRDGLEAESNEIAQAL